MVLTFKTSQNTVNFTMTEDYWQASALTRFFEIQGFKVNLQKLPLQVDKRIKRYSLGGRRAISLAPEMTEEYVYFCRSHLCWMAFVVEENIALDPVQVCFVCLKRLSLIAKILLYLVKKALRPLRGSGANIIHGASLVL